MASYEELQRRKKFNEALIAQSMQQDPNQMVSGRSVPYSPIQGISKLVQAYMGKSRADSTDQALQTGKEEAMKEMMQTYQGTPGVEGSPLVPQTGGPLRDQDYTPFTPEQPAVEAVSAVEGDPMKAAMMASTDPYLKGAAPVISAMMKQKGGGSSFSRPIVTNEGIYHQTPEGWVPMRGESDEVLMGGYVDPTLQADKARKIRQATSDVDVEMKPEIERNVQIQKAMGEAIGKAKVNLPATEVAAAGTLTLVDELLDHPGFEDAVGFWDNPAVLGGYMPFTEAKGFRTRLAQLQGRTFMEIFPTLKGGGQITEIEGTKGQDSINRMSTATTEAEFKNAARDFKSEVVKLRSIVRSRAGGETEQPTTGQVIKFDAQGEPIQ